MGQNICKDIVGILQIAVECHNVQVLFVHSCKCKTMEINICFVLEKRDAVQAKLLSYSIMQ